MRLYHLGGTFLFLALCAAITTAQSVKIAKAYADSSGTLHVTTSNGQDIRIPKEKGQKGAEEIKITEDHQTVGWLVVYPNPDSNRDWEKLYGELVLWRDGKVTRRFSTEQVFWSWDFWEDGKQVRFHTGPLHGAGRFELHDIASGRLLAAVDEEATQTLPDWAESLDH